MSKTMRQVFGEALVEMAGIFPTLRVLDADVSSSTQTRIFGLAHPDRFFNFGIAEGNMVAAAAGMATCGHAVVASSFASLLTMRALDPVHSLICYNNLNVTLAGGYAGLSDHADGASHQSVIDLAIARALPNMTVLAPSDEETTKAALRAALEYEGPVYLRLSRDVADSLHGGSADVRIGRAEVMREGRDVAVISTGTMLKPALEAAQMLDARGVSATVVDCVCVKPIDGELITDMARRHKKLITIEEHSIIGGLGDAVLEIVSARAPCPVLRIGIEDTFGQSARDYASLLAAYGLDAESISQRIAQFL